MHIPQNRYQNGFATKGATGGTGPSGLLQRACALQQGAARPGRHLVQVPMLQAQLHQQQSSGMLHHPQAQRAPAAEQVQGGGAGLRLTPQQLQLLDLLQASGHQQHQQQQAAPSQVPGDAQLQQLLQSLVRSQQSATLQEQGQYFQHGGQSSLMAPQASLCRRGSAV